MTSKGQSHSRQPLTSRQCCVQLCWWRYFRQESPEDRQPVIYINVCQFDRSNNSTKSLNRNAEPSHRSQVGLKQEYCAVIKKSGASSLILALSQLMIVLNNRFRPSQSVYNSQQHQRWDNDLSVDKLAIGLLCSLVLYLSTNLSTCTCTCDWSTCTSCTCCQETFLLIKKHMITHVFVYFFWFLSDLLFALRHFGYGTV